MGPSWPDEDGAPGCVRPPTPGYAGSLRAIFLGFRGKGMPLLGEKIGILDFSSGIKFKYSLGRCFFDFLYNLYEKLYFSLVYITF